MRPVQAQIPVNLRSIQFNLSSQIRSFGPIAFRGHTKQPGLKQRSLLVYPCIDPSYHQARYDYAAVDEEPLRSAAMELLQPCEVVLSNAFCRTKMVLFSASRFVTNLSTGNCFHSLIPAGIAAAVVYLIVYIDSCK